MKLFIAVFSVCGISCFGQFTKSVAFRAASVPPIGGSVFNVTFPGSELMAPGFVNTLAPQGQMWLNSGSTSFDAVNADGSVYKNYGILTSNTIADAEISVDAEYTSSGGATNQHSGIVTRISNDANNSDQDFAGMALISVGGNQFQIIDRVAGVERYTIVTNITPALSTGTHYWIHFENKNTNQWLAKLFASDHSTLLASNGGFFSAGVSNVGWQGFHTYSARMQVYNCTISDQFSNALIIGSPQAHFQSVATANSPAWGGCSATNNCLTLHSDSGTHEQNSWHWLYTSVSNKNFTMTGSLANISGIIAGLVFRGKTNGDCYSFTWNNGNIHLYSWSGFGPTDINSTSCSLTAGTYYPFTLTANGTSLSFTLNGANLNLTDSTYANGGWVGFQGYQNAAGFTNVSITTLP